MGTGAIHVSEKEAIARGWAVRLPPKGGDSGGNNEENYDEDDRLAARMTKFGYLAAGFLAGFTMALMMAR